MNPGCTMGNEAKDLQDGDKNPNEEGISGIKQESMNFFS
jgi:hypothetical protein